MEQALDQIARSLLYSVSINAVTPLLIVRFCGYAFRQMHHDARELSRALNEINTTVLHVASMTRDVAMMTQEILRRTE
jgi:hypothetical protein